MGCTASTLPNSGVPNYIAEDYDDFDNRDDIEIYHHHDDHKSEVHLQNGIDRRNNIITSRHTQQHHQRQQQRRQSSFSCGGGSDHHIGMGSGPLSLNCGANPTSITHSPEKCKRKEFSSSNAPTYCTAGVHQNIDDYLTEHSRQGLQYESATKQLQQLITPDEYDNLINIHPSQPPFLGSTYWVAVSPSQSSKKSSSYVRNSNNSYSSPPQQQQQPMRKDQQHHQLLMTPQEGDDHPDNSNGHQYYPSLITPSTVDETSPIRGIDGTIEVDECATFPTLLTPREDDDEECWTTRKLFSTKIPRQSFKFNCIHPSLPSRAVTPPPPSPGRFSKYENVTTFSGPGYQSSERYVTTLPSSKDPIRLRITESSNTSCNLHSSPSTSSGRSPGDYYSFDPHFLNSSYKITQNSRTYGNGLQIKSCSGFMTLEDINGNVLAVMKSIYATNAPRRIVYAPQQRFKGQMCSSFRLRSMGKCDTGSKKQRIMVVEGKEGIKLYPWVMVKKDSADRNSPCSVHYVVEEKKSGGSFQSSPSFIGRHGFDDGGQTHTVVSRMDDSENNCDNPKGRRSNKDRRSTGTPCCVIMRDRSNIDAVDMVISPGIDPCLMICYLAMHTKMDLEPVLASVGGF